MTRSTRIDVVGVGLNATDTFIPVAHYPERGSKVEFSSAKVLLGGQVATAMIACQQWGLRTRYVGKSATTAPPNCTAPNLRATASRLISSPHPIAPASKPSSSSMTPVNAPFSGNATTA